MKLKGTMRSAVKLFLNQLIFNIRNFQNHKKIIFEIFIWNISEGNLNFRKIWNFGGNLEYRKIWSYFEFLFTTDTNLHLIKDKHFNFSSELKR